jgi:hypothetical protein
VDLRRLSSSLRETVSIPQTTNSPPSIDVFSISERRSLLVYAYEHRGPPITSQNWLAMVSSSPVILISAAPHSISPEEHEQLVASTPVSFNDIPPVLRLHQDDISIEFDPPVEGLTPHELANGSLYIIERRVYYSFFCPRATLLTYLERLEID